MQTLKLRVLSTRLPEFEADFRGLLDRGCADGAHVEDTVCTIVVDVRTRGDAALIDYTQRLDNHQVTTAAELEIPRSRLEEAAASLAHAQRAAMERAANRIREYHEHQITSSWRYYDNDGTLLGQQVTPLARIGMYVPGGKAAYPSSVLMNAIPAKVAGVAEILMVVPAPGGELNDMVLAAARLVGVDRVFTVGGAQAIAALAYGTKTIPPVDKIVGPGNAYVTTAKRIVFGQVDIDMIAGPSEVVIVCDGRTDPAWVAMDLFAQAEHDEDAQAILLSLNEPFTRHVHDTIGQLLNGMERRAVIQTSLERHGALISVRDLDEAIDLVNRLAPEHLQLSIEEPLSVAERVRHAGAIFMGRYTAEVFGDYCAGPNHVLPTAGTARFSSPLGVYDFQKRTSLVMCTKKGATSLAKTASVLARSEGLAAHARSAEYRIEDSSK